jgi:2-haloalkanoic acid dehalogenase type II
MMPDLITFDCYGTLIDWRQGIAEAFRDVLPEAAAVEEAHLFDAYERAEAEVEGGSYRPYREVLAAAAARVAELLGWQIPVGRDFFLAESLPAWRPFADTNPSLERLASMGYRLGILSNIDDDLLAGTLRRLSVPFDLVVTAQSVGSYKPSTAHFRRALEEVGGRPERLLHVAESYHHDVGAARPLGIPVIWVNRQGRAATGDVRPTVEVRDLPEAVDWIARLGR